MMNKNILVIGEHKDGKIKKSILGILTKAKEINNEVSIALLGTNLTDNKELLEKFGVSKVYLYNNTNLENYNPEIYDKLITDLVNEIKPNYIFALASSLGKDLMPRITAELGVGLANDCTDVRLEGENLIFKRPIFAGKAFAHVVMKNEPAMATFRLNVLEPKEQEQSSKVETINKEVNVDMKNLSHKLIEVEKGKPGKLDLIDAEIIVSGGRWLTKNPEKGFELLKEFAAALGPNTAIGCSRPVVDEGIADHSMQVGQTGKTVNPKLYIAFGISGAMQHLAGMKTSKTIVAVDKDPEASIFQIADFGIIGDLFKILQALKEELKKLEK